MSPCSVWQVENNLHWVKDVVWGEDKAPLCAGHALTNFAIVRTIAVNWFRLNGFASVIKGIRAMAHDLHQLFSCNKSALPMNGGFRGMR
jgi:hypothetical protein